MGTCVWKCRFSAEDEVVLAQMPQFRTMAHGQTEWCLAQDQAPFLEASCIQ